MLDLMLIPNMLTSERIAFWPMADCRGHQPLYFDQDCSHLPTLYRNEGTNEGNHRPQYRGRLRLKAFSLTMT